MTHHIVRPWSWYFALRRIAPDTSRIALAGLAILFWARDPIGRPPMEREYVQQYIETDDIL